MRRGSGRQVDSEEEQEWENIITTTKDPHIVCEKNLFLVDACRVTTDWDCLTSSIQIIFAQLFDSFFKVQN
jgi:hypothetical protein